MACDAMIEVIMESTRVGQYRPGGTDLNNGFSNASRCSLIYAAWPLYIINKHGSAKQSHENRIAL